jgi:hypothetical protein
MIADIHYFFLTIKHKNVKAFVILVYQEYERANHHDLWNIMADITDDLFIVLNIPADYVVSRLKKKLCYRIADAKKKPKQIKHNLYLGRFLFPIRHEIAPKIIYPYFRRLLWKYLNHNFPQLADMEVDFLVYDPIWFQILLHSRKNIKFGYYLPDELRRRASDDKPNKKKMAQDDIASRYADAIYVASKALQESRQKVNKHVYFTGNGADLNIAQKYLDVKSLTNTVAYIGNLRDWTDCKLMEGIISKRSDIDFYFVGTVEENMRPFFEHLLNTYHNTFYFGKIGKDEIGFAYRRFKILFIPYRQNKFIQASRPLKIVECVMCGTPAVTVPVSGYKECDFIRFAQDVEEFSSAFDELMKSGINTESVEYKEFCNQYSWQNIGRIIIESLN